MVILLAVVALLVILVITIYRRPIKEPRSPIQKAQKHIDTMVGWAVFSCIVTTILSLGNWLGFTYLNLADAALAGIAAWRLIAARSRTWALVVTADLIGGEIMGFDKRSGANLLAGMVVMYYFVRGTIATFQYHRLMNSEVAGRTEI